MKFTSLFELNEYINANPDNVRDISIEGCTVSAVPPGGHAVSAVSPRSRMASLDTQYLAYVIFDDEKAAAAYRSSMGTRVEASLPSINAVRVYLTIPEFKVLKSTPKVEYVEILDPTEKAQIESVTVGGTEYADALNWGGRLSSIQDAWSRGFTGKGVKVAVLDTNFRTDIANTPLTKVFFATYQSSSPDPAVRIRQENHGQHCASAVCSPLNNALNVGMAPGCDLYGLNTNLYTTVIHEAYQWCIDNEMDIVSMSFGSTVRRTSTEMLLAAMESAGIICVASAGNVKNVSEHYPSDYESVVSVGAVRLVDGKYLGETSFSNNQPGVDFLFAGEAVLLTNYTGELAPFTGTSFAAPGIVGFLACLKEEYPEFSKAQLLSKLKEDCVSIPENYGTYPMYYARTKSGSTGVIARITPDGKLLLKGEVALGKNTSFTGAGFLQTQKVITSSSNTGVSLGPISVSCSEIVENADL